MKYQFNKIFPLLISKKKNTGKPHFSLDLGLLCPHLGRKSFLEVSALLDVRLYPKLQCCATSRKTNDANMRKR